MLIILVGCVMVLLGEFPLVAAVVFLLNGKPLPHGMDGSGALASAGVAAIAYGWLCVKGVFLKIALAFPGWSGQPSGRSPRAWPGHENGGRNGRNRHEP